MCYKDFKYFYITYVYCRLSKIGKIIKLFSDLVFSCCTLFWNSLYS